MKKVRQTTAGMLAVTLILSLGLSAGCVAKKHPILPAAVVDSLEAAFPKATIGEVELEKEGGLYLYEVELTQNGQETEVTVSPEGVIVEVEAELAMKDLPKAVADAITKAAGGAKIEEIEREEIRAVVRDGKLVKLEKPTITYEAEFRKGDKEIEIHLAPDGKILKAETEEDDDD